MSQIKTDTSTDVTYKEHYLSYSALRQIVHQKTCDFVGKFRVRPQYIKLPLWVYQYAKTLSDFRCIKEKYFLEEKAEYHRVVDEQYKDTGININDLGE